LAAGHEVVAHLVGAARRLRYLSQPTTNAGADLHGSLLRCRTLPCGRRLRGGEAIIQPCPGMGMRSRGSTKRYRDSLKTVKPSVVGVGPAYFLTAAFAASFAFCCFFCFLALSVFFGLLSPIPHLRKPSGAIVPESPGRAPHHSRSCLTARDLVIASQKAAPR